MPLKIDKRHGFGLVGILAAIAAAGVIMIPLTRWYISMTQGTEGLNEKLEMQSIIQDYWSQLNAATYDEFNEAIVAKGTTWTEDIGDKYKLTIEFSADGKFEDATCNVGAAAGADEKHCRKTKILLVSTQNPLLRESMEATRVYSLAENARLAAMENRITANEVRFGQYFTKSEVDARYIKKGEHF